MVVTDEMALMALNVYDYAVATAPAAQNRTAPMQAALTAALASMRQPKLTDVERKALEGALEGFEYEAGDVEDIAPSIDEDEDAYWAYHAYHGIRKLLLPAPPVQQKELRP